MGRAKRQLTEFARQTIEKAGLPFDKIARLAREVIVYGSRATGHNSPLSDLDVLVVGAEPHRRVKSDSLDMLWVSPELIDGPQWRGSELAGHIATYGQWILGNGNWKDGVSVSPEAIHQKQRQLTDRIEAFEAHWDDLSPVYRQRLFTLIRRDLQRLTLLRNNIPVPPTPRLDLEWKKYEDPLEHFIQLLQPYIFSSERNKASFTGHAVELLSRVPTPT